jgi:hypothetical protein
MQPSSRSRRSARPVWSEASRSMAWQRSPTPWPCSAASPWSSRHHRHHGRRRPHREPWTLPMSSARSMPNGSWRWRLLVGTISSSTARRASARRCSPSGCRASCRSCRCRRPWRSWPSDPWLIGACLRNSTGGPRTQHRITRPRRPRWSGVGRGWPVQVQSHWLIAASCSWTKRPNFRARCSRRSGFRWRRGRSC